MVQLQLSSSVFMGIQSGSRPLLIPVVDRDHGTPQDGRVRSVCGRLEFMPSEIVTVQSKSRYKFAIF
jgi:hypothetical protein